MDKMVDEYEEKMRQKHKEAHISWQKTRCSATVLPPSPVKSKYWAIVLTGCNK